MPIPWFVIILPKRIDILVWQSHLENRVKISTCNKEICGNCIQGLNLEFTNLP